MSLVTSTSVSPSYDPLKYFPPEISKPIFDEAAAPPNSILPSQVLSENDPQSSSSNGVEETRTHQEKIEIYRQNRREAFKRISTISNQLNPSPIVDFVNEWLAQIAALRLVCKSWNSLFGKRINTLIGWMVDYHEDYHRNKVLWHPNLTLLRSWLRTEHTDKIFALFAEATKAKKKKKRQFLLRDMETKIECLISAPALKNASYRLEFIQTINNLWLRTYEGPQEERECFGLYTRKLEKKRNKIKQIHYNLLTDLIHLRCFRHITSQQLLLDLRNNLLVFEARTSPNTSKGKIKGIIIDRDDPRKNVLTERLKKNHYEAIAVDQELACRIIISPHNTFQLGEIVAGIIYRHYKSQLGYMMITKIETGETGIPVYFYEELNFRWSMGIDDRLGPKPADCFGKIPATQLARQILEKKFNLSLNNR